jgi:AcrR family transcriptional regulator
VNNVNIGATLFAMPRPTYHHGDLPRALVAVALELVRAGGTDDVTIREVARRLEVSPAAIYRHFPDRDALLGAVARQIRMSLAQRMLDEVAAIDESDARARSVRRFVAVGRAYLDFAAEQPNLLAAAFIPVAPSDPHAEQPNPWEVLAAALNALVEAGAMAPGLRSGAEVFAWSTVHGFATLRANRSFDVSGDPDPDPSALLESIVRSLALEPSFDRTQARSTAGALAIAQDRGRTASSPRNSRPP